MTRTPTPFIDANCELNALDYTIIKNVCHRFDLGKKVVILELAEAMYIPEARMKVLCKQLVERGYLARRKHSPTPLRRPDGRTYQSLKKKAGITFCEPAVCIGYEPISVI